MSASCTTDVVHRARQGRAVWACARQAGGASEPRSGGTARCPGAEEDTTNGQFGEYFTHVKGPAGEKVPVTGVGAGWGRRGALKNPQKHPGASKGPA